MHNQAINLTALRCASASKLWQRYIQRIGNTMKICIRTTLIFLIFIAGSANAMSWCSQGHHVESPINAQYEICIDYSEELGRVNKFQMRIKSDNSQLELKEIYQNYLLSDLVSVLFEKNSVIFTFSGQGEGLAFGTVKIIFDNTGKYNIVALPN